MPSLSPALRTSATLAFEMLPYLVVRHAGCSASGFDRLVFERTVAGLDEYLSLEAECLDAREALCDALAEVVGTGQPYAVHAALIALRRDIYNDRLPRQPLPADADTELRVRLPAAIYARLQRWLAARERRERLLRDANVAFGDELTSGRRRFRQLLRNRRFRRGLALASPALSRELETYLAAARDSEVRRIRHTEQSLVRYYTRSAFKLTPFSTFTRTAVVRAAARGQTRRGCARSSVTLNRAFIGHLTDCLMSHPEVAEYVPIVRAGTLTRVDGSFLVLRRTLAPREQHVRLRVPDEALVVVPASESTEWVVRYLEQNGGAIPRGDLTAAAARHTGSADAAGAAAFIDKLLELGILVQRLPIPEDDTSGVESLCGFLARLPGRTARHVRSSLSEIDALRDQFAHADAAARARILPTIEAQAADLLAAAGAVRPPVWTGRLVYEDCVEPRVASGSATGSLQAPVADLAQFLASCGAIIDDNSFHRRTLTSILCEQFNSGPVPLLRLAERWGHTRSGCCEQAHSPLDSRALNPLGLEDLRRLMELRRELGAVIAEGSHESDIDLGAVAARHDWFGRSRAVTGGHAVSSWYSCYGQPLFTDGGGGAALVVNTLVGGPARALAHVLRCLDDPEDRLEVVEGVRRATERLCVPAESCQLAATFDYNANLAAALTDRVINYTDDPSLPAGKCVDIGQLEVAVEGGHTVLLDRRCGRRVVPYDCGMMASALQPPLHRLLVLLGGAADVPLRLFEPYLWRRDETGPAAFERFPRIRFGACILRRRGWGVPAHALPRAQSGGTPFGDFVRVRRWQRELGLPDEVFVRATSFLEWKDQALQRQDRQTWNRRKPQYVNFRNYFLIDVLLKLLEHTRTRLYVEEMLPDRASWWRWRLRRPAEIVLDIGMPAEGGAKP